MTQEVISRPQNVSPTTVMAYIDQKIPNITQNDPLSALTAPIAVAPITNCFMFIQ